MYGNAAQINDSSTQTKSHALCLLHLKDSRCRVDVGGNMNAPINNRFQSVSPGN
jgi:hypothetical protein